ncbi:MAG: hypothetical protein CM1200mP20_07730 [Pseudomonadota bacterium]|nr:MAG: hypothetical protein CM1200mP20_07730 [Pseudomonadota bacterium]
MVPLSVLDLSPITQGNNASQALHNSLDLAQQAERLGFNRYWVAEHHGMAGIASAATSVVIGHIAGGTRVDSCRIGGHHATQSRTAGYRGAVRPLWSRFIPGGLTLALAGPRAPISSPPTRCAAR